MPSHNLPRTGQLHAGFNLPSGPCSTQQYRFILMVMDLASGVDPFPDSSPRENYVYGCLVMYTIYFQVHNNSVFENK